MQRTRDNPIVTRKLKPEDVYEVVQIEKQCFSDPWSESAILESALSPNSYFIVAVKKFEKEEDEEKKILGYAGLYAAGEEAYVYNIAVRPEWQGKGIGKSLINELVSYCLKNNLGFISLEVRISNNIAINLYKKFGFKILGKRRNFYKNPSEDALIMTKYFIVDQFYNQ